MKINDFLEVLSEISPFELAEKWDNSGLLVGSENNNVNDLYFSLDITLDIVKQLKEGSTLVTHHPLIFKPLKELNFDSYEGKIIKELIKKDIDYIALHTNFDKAIMNEYFVCETLGIKYEHISKINDFLITYELNEKTKIENLAKEISESLIMKNMNIVKSNEYSKKIAVCTGSGGSLLRDAINNGVDTLLTGDVTHHVAMEAKDMGISIIDISHYFSENIFGKILDEELMEFEDNQDILSSLQFDYKNHNITILDSGNPFKLLSF